MPSNSSLCELFENKTIGRGWLLGDSGYPLRPHLLTPVLNPNIAKQNTYMPRKTPITNVMTKYTMDIKMMAVWFEHSSLKIDFSMRKYPNSFLN